MLEFKNVNAGYGRRVALRDINLNIGSGAVGLLGPNGAGKSTLLKTILGFIPPLSGHVTVLGHPVPKEAAQARALIGYMPESESFIPGMTGVQMTSYMAQLSGLPASMAMERAHEVLYYVGLKENRYRNVETYSLGMKQRIKLAQAIVHGPRLLLLDEPTNGLDPEGRREMLELIADLANNKGLDVIFCSHLLPEVESVVKEIIVLSQGQVVSRQLAQPVSDGNTPLVFRLRLRGAQEQTKTFSENLKAAGWQVAPFGESLDLKITFPNRESMTTTAVFEAAHAAGCVVQRLETEKQSLEATFAETVSEINHAHL